jgi:hypothetical protein
MSEHDIEAQVDRLRQLNEQRGALLKELDESLAIVGMWPEAFDAGPVKAQWQGKRMAHVAATIRRAELGYPSDHPMDTPEFLADAQLTIIRPDGVSRTFNYDEVHMDLRCKPLRRR